jgi:hypothetical protein
MSALISGPEIVTNVLSLFYPNLDVCLCESITFCCYQISTRPLERLRKDSGKTILPTSLAALPLVRRRPEHHPEKKVHPGAQQQRTRAERDDCVLIAEDRPTRPTMFASEGHIL